MFDLDSHLRHFFSPVYARSCLNPDFTLVQLDERRGPLSGQASAFIEVIAQAR